MNTCKNLNDIPKQFRQFENSENNVKNNADEDKIQTEKIKSENFQINQRNNQVPLSLNDKIFIFLIIAVFFDII